VALLVVLGLLPQLALATSTPTSRQTAASTTEDEDAHGDRQTAAEQRYQRRPVRGELQHFRHRQTCRHIVAITRSAH